MSHTDVMKHYRSFLRIIEKAMTHNQTTGNVELERMGRHLFGVKFRGVFASDGFPALSARQPYAIVNNRPASSGGEHWLGVARIPRTGKLLVYDSYGRPHATLLNSIPKGAEDTEPDAEQSIVEKNCGQRALAWLAVFDRFGPAAARKV